MASCPICNGIIYFLEGIKTQDGKICSECAHIVSSPKEFTMEKIKSLWVKNHGRMSVFKETRVLHSPGCLYISIDDTNRLFTFGRGRGNNHEHIVYSFDEVDSYEIITIKGETIVRKKGIFTRAVVGGLVGGVAGAIIGGATAENVIDEKPSTNEIRVHFTTCSGKVQEISSSNCPYPTGFTEFLDSCILGDSFVK